MNPESGCRRCMIARGAMVAMTATKLNYVRTTPITTGSSSALAIYGLKLDGPTNKSRSVRLAVFLDVVNPSLTVVICRAITLRLTGRKRELAGRLAEPVSDLPPP